MLSDLNEIINVMPTQSDVIKASKYPELRASQSLPCAACNGQQKFKIPFVSDWTWKGGGHEVTWTQHYS